MNTETPYRPLQLLRTAALLLLVLIVLTGLAYPLAVTGIAQLTMRDDANGSLVERDGVVVGSALIGQNFWGSSGYFWGRPSAAGSGYDANQSGGANLGPSNPALVTRIEASIAELRAANWERGDSPIPVDLVTTSASGLDPHISPAAAEYQAPRIARERGLSEDQVLALVRAHTEGRWLWVFGEERVNVLELNLALDALAPIGR
ncbi:MAG: potassium-transporting ATPase subunit C [Chloroflexi bacterium]|nr:MAG: potassium-transporting ATPase subunit C [Chloroflexota bacterium]